MAPAQPLSTVRHFSWKEPSDRLWRETERRLLWKAPAATLTLVQP